jgi:hypothetical protein
MRIEEWMSHAMARTATLVTVSIADAMTAPFALPILPVDMFIRYETAIGYVPSAGEREGPGVLPQYYADMFGWHAMAKSIAAVYEGLPPQDRARAVFFGQNYGEAAAIDVLGRDLGLPPAISGHNSYYIWGPRGHDGSVVITIGGSKEDYAGLFQSIEIVGRTAATYAMPYEADQPIYVLRGMKIPLQTYWPEVKKYR